VFHSSAHNSNVSSLQRVKTQQTTAAATVSPFFQTSSCFVDHDNKQKFKVCITVHCTKVSEWQMNDEDF
jgi:hypothetical protein